MIEVDEFPSGGEGLLFEAVQIPEASAKGKGGINESDDQRPPSA